MNRTQDYYRHHVERVTSNRNEAWNEWLREDYNISIEGYPETSTRFSKHSPFDCGITGCPICHPEKLKKRRFKLNDAQIQEKLFVEWGTPEPEEVANYL